MKPETSDNLRHYQRQRFEEWAVSEGLNVGTVNGKYDFTTEKARKAWQAASSRLSDEGMVQEIRLKMKEAYFNYKGRAGMLDHNIATLLAEAALQAIKESL